MRPAQLLGAGALAIAACAAPERAADDAQAAVRREVESRLGALARERPGVVAEARVRSLLVGGVDEDEAVRVALLTNRALAARYEELGVQAADLEQSSLWANPVLGAGVLFFGDGTEIDLGLSQSFVDVILRPRRAAAARHALDAARARVAREVLGHAFATRRAHVAALAARARLEIESKHAAAAEAAVELVRRLLAAGNVAPFDAALEESALAARLLERSSAELSFHAARETLAREMGVWGDLAEFEIAGEISAKPAADLDPPRLESRAVAASLDLAEARARIAALTATVGASRLGARIPDADLGIGAAKDHDSAEWGLGPRVAVGVPLADGGSTRAFGVQAQLSAAESDHWARAVAIRSMARTFRARLHLLDSDARFAREVLLPAERHVVEETLRRYNAMQVGVFDVLRAQGAVLMAERRAVLLSAEAAQARLDLEELLAGRANDARLSADGHAMTGITARDARKGH